MGMGLGMGIGFTSLLSLPFQSGAPGSLLPTPTPAPPKPEENPLVAEIEINDNPNRVTLTRGSVQDEVCRGALCLFSSSSIMVLASLRIYTDSVCDGCGCFVTDWGSHGFQCRYARALSFCTTTRDHGRDETARK